MGYAKRYEALFLDRRLAAAASGDPQACYELGLAYSVGNSGVDVDLVEAHKWFNLAALSGLRSAQQCRAEIACEMEAWEIAEAQRAARAWMQGRRAA